MRIYFIRHGQTPWNLERKLCGNTDVELNDEGISQAMDCKEKIRNLDIDLIVCSPLKRTVKTAEIINQEKKIPVFYESGFVERCYGDLKGLHPDQYNFEEIWDYDKNVNYQNFEPVKDFCDRCIKTVNEIISKYNDKNILIVAHGGVFIALDLYLRKIKMHGYLFDLSKHIKNCEVVNYEIDNCNKKDFML